MEDANRLKRYEVFISSTYKDLKVERSIVMKAILDMGYIPTGMEEFPATDQEQFSYIKRIIDTADYFILIMGGQCGSMYDTETGISYTRMEYEYACEKGIPIIVFVKSDEEDNPLVDDNDLFRANAYQRFLETVQKSRMRQSFRIAEELSGLVLHSLTEETRAHPRYGWIRDYKPELIHDNLLLRGRLIYYMCIDRSIYYREDKTEKIQLSNYAINVRYGQGTQGVFSLTCWREGEAGRNFFYDIADDEIDCFDEEGLLRDEYKIQLSFASMGNIDEPLLFLSVGDGQIDMITKVFRIGNYDFKMIGRVCGQEKMIVDYTLVSPYGSQGLYDSYVYCDGEIMRVESLDYYYDTRATKDQDGIKSTE